MKAALRRLLACAAVTCATAGFAVASVAEVPVAAAVSAAPVALEVEPASVDATRSPHDWDGLIELVLEYLDQGLGSDSTAESTTPTS